jgi:altronate dehydratase small subunit
MKAIQIDEKDNVATITSDVEPIDEVEILDPQGAIISKTKLTDEIGFGHKIALKPCEKGDEIIKYGEVIGIASESIPSGAWIHTHNVESKRLPTKKLEMES